MYPSLGFPQFLEQLNSPPQGQPVGPDHSALVDNVLASGKKNGYVFSYAAEPGESRKTVAYKLVVRPQRYGEDGKRSYYTDQSGDIRFTDQNRPPTASDPVLR
jgi:hypothetical protein